MRRFRCLSRRSKEGRCADTVSAVQRFHGEYEFLSDFYRAKLMYDGIAYYNAEAAYQAQKCADPDLKKHFKRLYSD